MMCCALWLFSVGKIRAIFCNIFYMSCTLFYEKTYNFQRLKCLPLGRCNFRSPFLSQLTQRICIQILGQKSWWMWAFEPLLVAAWKRHGCQSGEGKGRIWRYTAKASKTFISSMHSEDFTVPNADLEVLGKIINRRYACKVWKKGMRVPREQIKGIVELA